MRTLIVLLSIGMFLAFYAIYPLKFKSTIVPKTIPMTDSVKYAVVRSFWCTETGDSVIQICILNKNKELIATYYESVKPIQADSLFYRLHIPQIHK